MKRKRVNSLTILVVAALVAGIFSYRQVPFFATGDAKIYLSGSRDFVAAGGKAQITVLGFAGSGEALRDHTTVLLQATLGSVPAQVELMNGWASCEFVAGTESGVATVRAFSGNASASNNGVNPLPARALGTAT